MDNDRQTQVAAFISGLLLGAVIGAGVALLAAPDSGRKTRRRIKKAAGDLKGSATDRWEELSEEVKGKVDDALQGAKKRFGS